MSGLIPDENVAAYIAGIAYGYSYRAVEQGMSTADADQHAAGLVAAITSDKALHDMHMADLAQVLKAFEAARPKKSGLLARLIGLGS